MEMIITYDVHTKHSEVKSEMFKIGFKDRFLDSKNEYVYLPNTTLYHSSKTPTEARDTLRAICTKLDVKLLRCIATKLSDWAAIYGEPL